MNLTVQKPLSRYLICIFLAGITFAAFASLAHGSFITLDDQVYVLDDPHVQRDLSWSAICWAFQSIYAGFWIPVTWMSYMLDWQFFGLNPAAYHLTNVVFHVANTVLLFLLLQKMTARLGPSAFAALLFGIHPMHVESVAWITERKDVLSAFFLLLTLLAYTRYTRLQPQSSRGTAQNKPNSATRNPQSILAYALALLFFALGLMSKPMLVTLPFLLLLLDYWPLKRFIVPGSPEAHPLQPSNASTLQRLKGQALLVEKIPFFLLSAIFCYVTFIAQNSTDTVLSSAQYSFANRFNHVLVSYGFYILKFFWPVHLSAFYPLRPEPFGLNVILAALLLLAVTAVAFKLVFRIPYVLVGWLWFLGMLVPVIGVLQSGEQAYADRFVYLPYIGLFIIVAWGIPDLLSRKLPGGSVQSATFHPRSSALLWIGAAVAIACFVRTVQEAAYWKNGVTLFERAVKLDPENALAWALLGTEYADRGNNSKAIEDLNHSLALRPNSHLAWLRLGLVLASNGDSVRAENAFNMALKFGQLSGRMETYNALGSLFMKDQRYSDAISAFQNSLDISSTQPEIQTRLGQCLLQTKQPDLAAAAFQNAIDAQPNNSEAQMEMGMLLAGSGNYADGLVHLHAAVDADPNSVMALSNLAWLLAAAPDPAIRNGQEAVSMAERACRLTAYQKPQVIGTLAAAYAEAGRFNDAILAAQKARDVALATGDKKIADRNAQLLELYKSHKAFHMGSDQ